MSDEAISMDNVIYLDIECLPSGKCDGQTSTLLNDVVNNNYPNALRVDYKGRESRGRSAVFIFRIWLNDPENLVT